MAITLKNGSTGKDVKNLQVALQEAGYSVGSTGADGVYGKNTAAAVKAYQKANGLAVDGIAGKNTLGSLYGTSGSKSSGSSSSGSKSASTKATPTTTTAAKAKTVAETSDPDVAPKAEDVPVTADNSDADIGEAPVAVLKPYTYEDFSYDKTFEYDDFSYDDFTYSDYAESDTVKQANSILQQHSANKPGAYQSQWQTQIDDYLNKIENREAFSYDFNNDALYQLYKDNYIQQGQMAMMDTMGQAASMTGGYGNSYAQTVGQQAYNQQLNQLNDVIPELYQLAHDQYAYEGQQLADMYNMYLDRENQDYGRYQTDLGNWYNELEYLTGRYDTERNFDYNKYQTEREQAYNQYSDNRNLAYDQYSTNRNTAYNEFAADRETAYNNWATKVDMGYKNYQTAIQNSQWQAQMDAEDARWQAEFDEDTRRYNQEWDAEQAELAKKSSSTGGTVTKEPTYKDIEPGGSVEKSIEKRISTVTTMDQLQQVYEYYVDLGYSPASIQALMKGKLAELQAGNQVVDTTVTTGDGPLSEGLMSGSLMPIMGKPISLVPGLDAPVMKNLLN